MDSYLNGVADVRRLIEGIAGDRGLGVSMFAVVREAAAEPFVFRTIDVSRSQQTEDFDRDVVLSALEEYADPDKRYATLDVAADLRGTIARLAVDGFPLVDLPNNPTRSDKDKRLFPAFLNALPSLLSQYDQGLVQSLSFDDFDRVAGMLFIYQFEKDNILYGYQKMLRSSMLRRSSLLLRTVGGSGFRLFTDGSIKISNHFDFIVVGDEIAAARPSTLIQQFRLIESRKERALEVKDTIARFVDSTDLLEERVRLSRTRTISKLLRISDSPVAKMEARFLRKRLENSDEYAGQFKFDKSDRIAVGDAATLDRVLKMLNNEIVTSPISDAVYESEIKDRIR